MTASYYNYWGKARRDDDLAGDGFHLLPYHSLDVAACAWILLGDDYPWCRGLAAALGLPAAQLRHLLTFFLCLHDIGKFSRAFQGLVQGLSDRLVPAIPGMIYSERHDSLGYWLWRQSADYRREFEEALGLEPRETKRPGQFDRWFRVVTGHHGQPPKEHGGRLAEYFAVEDLAVASAFTREMLDWWLRPEDVAPLRDRDLTRRLDPLTWKLAGLAVLADWLGSNQRYFRYQSAEMPLRDYWERRALPAAEEAVLQAGLMPRPVEPFHGIRQQFDFIREPTPLQAYAETVSLGEGAQLFILEDVTGAGKTEAAMVLVHRLMAEGRAAGLYVGLPTMATANAMYDRLSKCYRALYAGAELPSLVLAHGARHLSEAFLESVALTEQPGDRDYGRGEASASAYCNAWLADSRKKALLADVGVGTIDQALLAVLPARHQSLRVLGLERKVLLVDEVHAYDPYMRRLLESLLQLHASQGGSAVLLSATLPQQMKQALVAAYAKGRGLAPPQLESGDYPLATRYPDDGRSSETGLETRDAVKRKVRVERLVGIDAALALIRETVGEGRCICWIRNTVDDARDAVELLRSSSGIPEEYIQLFHSRFAMADRQHIEDETLERFGSKSDHAKRRGRVLVATQVVEQSLDLDFDVLISDIAPIDLLLQRAGRLQRHLRDRLGNILEAGLRDQREPPQFYLLAPEPIDDADADWLAEHRGSLAVYQDPGLLWRSVRVLFDRGAYEMPADARPLIETVYSPDTELVTPPAFDPASNKAQGKHYADVSMAGLNLLDLPKGYSQSSNDTGWCEEANVPTRLSDKTVSVVLVVPSASGGWQPYADDHDHAWDLSTLKLRESQWQEAERALTPELREQMEALQAERRALCWCHPFPLVDAFVDWYHPEFGWMGSKGGAK